MKQYQGEFFRAIEEDSFGTGVLSTADVCTACSVVGAVNRKQDPFLHQSVLLCDMNKNSISHCS